MKNLNLIFLLVLVFWCTCKLKADANFRANESLRFDPFLKRKLLYSYSSTFGAVIDQFNPSNNASVLTVQPRVSYFLLDKFSLNAAYLGIRLGFKNLPQFNNYYNSMMLDFSYYFHVRDRHFMFAQAGYILSQSKGYTERINLWRKQPGSLLDVALGIGVRSESWSRFSFIFKPIIYFNLNTPVEKVDSSWYAFEFGVCYSPKSSIHRKKTL